MGQSTGDIQRCCPFTKVHLFAVPNVDSNCIDCRAKIALKCFASRRQKTSRVVRPQSWFEPSSPGRVSQSSAIEQRVRSKTAQRGSQLSLNRSRSMLHLTNR